MENLGVYIHIPFCVSKCKYCDFNSYDDIPHVKKDYVNALLNEIEKSNIRRADTVFIGGGTPTSLDIDDLISIAQVVEAKEVTVEVNPATASIDDFVKLKKAGVNRISIGLQSANNEELKVLGRIHTFEQFVKTYYDAKKAGIDNINVDLMFSLPYQTLERWMYTLKTVVAIEPQHISCYSLIIEEGTPFYDMELTLPTEEEDRAMYEYAVRFLGENGYHQYEISNFAKPGFECKHNIKYWRRAPYIGFGAGAHSMVDNIRYSNTMDVLQYIENNEREENILTKEEIMEEYVFLALRMVDGIDLNDFKNKFNKDFVKINKNRIDEFCKLGLIEISNNRLFLTLDGISVSNTIISELM